MHRLVIALAAVAALSACASLEEKAGPVAAKWVNNYCTSLPFEVRQLNRQSFNRMISPNLARIDCAGDPPLAPGEPARP
jgi:hypothetical protein